MNTLFQALLDFFTVDTPGKTAPTLNAIGKVSLIIAFGAVAIVLGLDSRSTDPELPLVIAVRYVAIAGLFVGFCIFIAIGINYISSKQKINHFRAAIQVAKGTFLYIFLPTLIILAGIIAWGVLSNQPGFRITP